MFPNRKKNKNKNSDTNLAGDGSSEKTSAFLQDIINNQKVATVLDPLANNPAAKGKMVTSGNMDKNTYNSIKNDVKNSMAGGNPFANGGDPFAGM